MIPEYKDLVKRIKQKRKELGISQKELARMAGVSQSLIAKIESNRIMASYLAMQKIENVLESLANKKEKKAGELGTEKIAYVNADDKVKKAIKIIKENDYSQLPVKQGKESVGSVTEADLMGQNKDKKIKDVMGPIFDIVSWNTPKSAVAAILKDKQKKAVLVRGKKGKIIRIITPQDLL